MNRPRIQEHLDKNLMLVTALNAEIGYEKAAKIAKTAAEALKDADIDAALDLEEELNRKRAELAPGVSLSSPLPEAGELSVIDQQMLAAAVNISVQQLLNQLLQIQEQDTQAREALQAMSDDEYTTAIESFEAGRQERLASLNSIQRQLEQFAI